MSQQYPPAAPGPDHAHYGPPPSAPSAPGQGASAPDAPLSGPGAPAGGTSSDHSAYPSSNQGAYASPSPGLAPSGTGRPLHAPDHDPEPDPSSDAARHALSQVRSEVGKAIVGQNEAVAGLIVALLCRGHVLLEGVPGVAKTLMVRSLAASLDLQTKRVQFTPDLMPGDITGSLVYDARTAEFSFAEGPVFTNLLLADEINRTPPKTQAALLEAMEERQVSVDGTPRALPEPFMVIATQNPVEYEGTYPLPEAQLDRFLLKLVLPLPERGDEIEVVARHAAGFSPRDLSALQPVLATGQLDAARAAVAKVHVAPEVLAYIVDLARATRTAPSVALGVSPRGATALLATSRAWAWLTGRHYVTPDDVKALTVATFNHRIQLRPEAEIEGITTASVLRGVLGNVQVPR